MNTKYTFQRNIIKITTKTIQCFKQKTKTKTNYHYYLQLLKS